MDESEEEESDDEFGEDDILEGDQSMAPIDEEESAMEST